MLLMRFANYLQGVVHIRISGAFPEKFINLCLARGIFLWGIFRDNGDLVACVRLADFLRIRPLVRLSRCRVQVVGHDGFPFTLKRVRRRKMMVMGGLLFFFFLNLLSSYVWFVDVSGQKMLAAESIRALVAEHGLKPGVRKELVDVKALEKEVLLTLPEVAWVGIRVTGTRAVVEVVEKTLPKPEDKSPAHVIAAKDGVITEIIALAGQAAVKKGDTVKKGDLLIKGFTPTPPPEDGKPPVIMVPASLIRAGGIVKARVWYESYGESGLSQEVAERTGGQVMAITVRVGQHEVILKKAPEPPFPAYDTEVIRKKLPGGRNSDFIVESTINIFHELSSVKHDISPEQARDLARGKALSSVQNLIPEGAQVLGRDIAVLQTAEPGLVRVRVLVETVEDIGQTMNINH
jgi:similar to stage IV sporulation protein